jgi:hypothetical protein
MGVGVAYAHRKASQKSSFGVSQSYSEPVAPNPDPTKFRLVDSEEVGDWLVVKINYPGCTNYEGDKIMVYKNMTLKRLWIHNKIDPHFFKGEMSPVARFEPTAHGWDMALAFAKMMTSAPVDEAERGCLYVYLTSIGGVPKRYTTIGVSSDDLDDACESSLNFLAHDGHFDIVSIGEMAMKPNETTDEAMARAKTTYGWPEEGVEKDFVRIAR